MWKYYACTLVSRDCTQGYELKLDKDYTVGEFIQQVLTERSDEWGYIRVKYGKKEKSLFSLPSSEYRYGRILNELPEQYMKRKVKSATANGGWSAMDYVLQV